jgi:hypothetical protein
MISNRFTTSIAIKRSTWVDGKATKGTAGSFNAHVQQATMEEAQVIGQAYGLAHFIWCSAATDVRKGDALEIAAGPYAGTYNVSAIINHSPVSSQNAHLELVAVKDSI